MEKFPMRKDWIECGGGENLFVGKDVWSLLPALLSFEQQLPFSQIRACPEYFMTSLLNFLAVSNCGDKSLLCDSVCDS